MSTSPDLFLSLDSRLVAHVYRMPSGTVYCFDAESRLLQEYCGKWSDLEATIRRNMRHDAVVHE